jgi:hypothetical protein
MKNLKIADAVILRIINTFFHCAVMKIESITFLADSMYSAGSGTIKKSPRLKNQGVFNFYQF